MRIYKFTTSRSPGNLETYEKKESELNDNEKKLLLGELINTWNNTPDEIQNKFLNTILKK
jgi:hypothetical protein